LAIFGYCDGVKGDDLYGWAWDPETPNESIAVEILIDGAPAFETRATLYRPDLRAAGIGHGRYGWRVTLGLDPDRAAPVNIVARARTGDPFVDGTMTLDVDIPPSDRDNKDFQSFLATILGHGAAFAKPAPAPPPPAVFLLHCPVALASDTMGAPEYSYGFVLRAFQPLLAQLGRTVTVANADEADRVVADALAAGETATCLSFAPPQRTILGLRCPVVPVIAWEFPTIPDWTWDEEPRNDWRFVLRQCGRAITLSGLAADAVRATMGADFPVAAIPCPVWDRFPELQTVPCASGPARLAIDGFVFDTRGRAFSPTTAIPPLPSAADHPSTVELDGVVFTSVFSPRDGRKNWLDIATAFCTALRHQPNATLVFKMVGPDPAIWWWELFDVLNGLRAFDCRLVVLHGFLDDASYNALVRASHWVVNASHAEGQCLPLLEYLCAGRPAISPAHTAMADYITPDDAIVVASDEEDCGYPHDPALNLVTTRHRVAWDALAAAFSEGYEVATTDPDRYERLSARARETMRDYCSDAVVGARLDGWLGLNLGRARLGESPSALLRAIGRP
jgi:glycosyltransferase involved in cell wall biosynthesis